MGVYIETQYLPNISYFAALLPYNEVLIEAHEHYQKQSYRNRCEILTSQGKRSLVVPVLHTQNKILMKDVRIDNSQSWSIVHWRSIGTVYRKAPYFEYFVDYFESVYSKKVNFLIDLNQEVLSICLKLLQIKPTVRLTEVYEKKAANGHFDCRGLISPKKQIELAQIGYRQNFGNEFVPNLSVIDLLMNEGTGSKAYLSKIITFERSTK